MLIYSKFLAMVFEAPYPPLSPSPLLCPPQSPPGPGPATLSSLLFPEDVKLFPSLGHLYLLLPLLGMLFPLILTWLAPSLHSDLSSNITFSKRPSLPTWAKQHPHWRWANNDKLLLFIILIFFLHGHIIMWKLLWLFLICLCSCPRM